MNGTPPPIGMRAQRRLIAIADRLGRRATRTRRGGRRHRAEIRRVARRRGRARRDGRRRRRRHAAAVGREHQVFGAGHARLADRTAARGRHGARLRVPRRHARPGRRAPARPRAIASARRDPPTCAAGETAGSRSATRFGGSDGSSAVRSAMRASPMSRRRSFGSRSRQRASNAPQRRRRTVAAARRGAARP